MIEVKFVDLSKLGVSPPTESVRMVLAQPYLPNGVFTSNEPYRVTGAARDKLVRVVERTLDVACRRIGSTAKTDFTVFPEYSIPGLDGVEVVEDRLRATEWPNGTVVIGGLDGITKSEYGKILEADGTEHDQELNGVARVGDDQWVNCAITWVKDADGGLSRWVQPKICPAWPEASSENKSLFKGGSVFLFRGQRPNGEPYIFGTMICFDWIAQTTPRPYERILEETHKAAGGAQLPLTWMFVIQRNEKPSHYEFLNNVVGFFRAKEFPNATRINASVVFVNTAGLGEPGYCEEYGSTSLVFGPSASFMTLGPRPTLSHEGHRYRDQNEEILKSAQCTDVYFRERGACIHAFDQINPSSLQGGAASRAYAVDNGEVHAADDQEYLLARGAGVPTVVKWANDVLDQTTRDLPDHSSGLTKDLTDAHNAVVGALRSTTSMDMAAVVRLATPPSRDNPEEWGSEEAAGLRHVLKTLRIVGAGGKLRSVGTDMAHGVVSLGGVKVEVAAIQDESHESCVEHLRRGSRRQRGQILLVSRDRENGPWNPKRGRFLNTRSRSGERGPRFTDPVSPTYHVGYYELLGLLSEASDLDEIEREIEASVAA